MTIDVQLEYEGGNVPDSSFSLTEKDLMFDQLSQSGGRTPLKPLKEA